MRLWFVGLLIFTVLIISGCSTNKAVTEEDCNRLLDRDLRGECIYNLSLTNRNPAYCKEIPGLKLRAECIDEIAVLLDHDIYCYQHERLSARESCERKVADARRKAKAAQK